MTLRLEIVRLKKLMENKSKIDGVCARGTRVDCCFQTDNIYKENLGKNVTQSLTDKDGGFNIDLFNDTQQSDRVHKEIENNINNEKQFGNYGNYKSKDNGDQNDFMRGMLNYFESLQVSMPLPKFDGNKKNPMEFIK